MSIMDKYRKNKASFVNREQPIMIIQEKLDALHIDSSDAESELINFWGMGGEGKTELKKQIREKYDYKNNHTKHKTNLTNYIIVEWDADVHFHRNYSLPEVLISFRNQFVRYGYQMEEFTKYITFYRHYTAMILPDLFDENEENITKPLLKGMLDVVSFSTGLNSLVEGALGFVQAAQQNNKSKKLKEEYEQFGGWRDDAQTMQAILLDAFIHDVNEEITEQKIIFMLDTFEDVRSSNLDWIFPKKQEDTDQPNLFYSLQPALWLVFGREKVDLIDRQTSIQLKHFDKKETDKYIEENLRQFISDEHEQVFESTRGYPLLLADLYARMTRTKNASLEKMLTELKKNESMKAVIIDRYKEYFLNNNYSSIETTLLKIFFVYRYWRIDTVDITLSPVYQFADDYIGKNMSKAEALSLEGAMNKLLNLSFIRKVASNGSVVTYGIDKTIYEALKDETIDDAPIIPKKLQKDMVAFFMQRLQANNPNLIGNTEQGQHIEEVHQMIELMRSIYVDMTYAEFHEKLTNTLKESNIDEKSIVYIQILMLEKFEQVGLESNEGQRIIGNVLENIKQYGLFDDIDRFIHAIEKVRLQRWLNETIGYYLFSIHKFEDAKKYLEDSIPILDEFQHTDVYHDFGMKNPEDNTYCDELYRTLSLQPQELIKGFQSEGEVANMQHYRNFLHNVGLLIRTNMQLGNSYEMKRLLLPWSVAISYDKENIDKHKLHYAWYSLDKSLIENTIWEDTFLGDLKHEYIPLIERNKWFIIEEPEFAMTMVKVSNRLLEIEEYELEDKFYNNVALVLMYLLQNPREEGEALIEMLNRNQHNRLQVERSVLFLKHGHESSTGLQREFNKVKAYFEQRVAEDWQQPLVLSEALDVCFTDVKLLDYLHEKEACIKVLNDMIERVKETRPNSYHLGECYFLKGKYLMELGNWMESYESFHQSGKIIRKNLGKFAETSKALIPYETYENYTYMYLLQQHMLPVNDELLEQFSERLNLNRKMINNYYADNLPDALQLYRLGVQANQGIDFLKNESIYDGNLALLKSLFNDITVEQYHRIIQRLGKFLFMDALAKYEEEYMARTENYPPIILFEEVEGHVQEAEKLWELSVIPESVKNELYQYAQDCIDDLVNDPGDYEQFFETYFLRMKVVYHKNNETNEVSKFFGGQMILTVDVLSNMNYHRDKIISILVKKLS